MWKSIPFREFQRNFGTIFTNSYHYFNLWKISRISVSEISNQMSILRKMAENGQKCQIFLILRSSHFWTREPFFECDTNFPLRIWCPKRLAKKFFRISANWRFWRFLVAILALFLLPARYFFSILVGYLLAHICRQFPIFSLLWTLKLL